LRSKHAALELHVAEQSAQGERVRDKVKTETVAPKAIKQ
jgi:hypothetical protein